MSDIKYYEMKGSPIESVYQLWFADLAKRVNNIIDNDGINYRIRRRKYKHKKRSSYTERYYNKIKRS